MSRHKKGPAEKKKKAVPSSETALRRLRQGPLGGLAASVRVYQDGRVPMAREDWAYVTSQGSIYLNPNREASVSEWEYVLAHCMLHLGLGHFQPERMEDPLWVSACDLVVTRFLRDGRIGKPPPEFSGELPVPAKSEEQALEQLRGAPSGADTERFSTMTRGRPDMVWTGESRVDYEERLAQSLQASMRDAVREAAGLPPGMREGPRRAPSSPPETPVPMYRSPLLST